MKIRYLGTAAAEGWPGVFCNCESCNRARELGGKNIRTRSQAIIDGKLLVDFPPDSYLHMLQGGYKLGSFASLLVTHSHQDHFYPTELNLRGKPYAHNIPAPVLTVYGNEAVERQYQTVVNQADSPDIKTGLAFVRCEPFTPFVTAEGYTVTPLPADHDRSETCLIYCIEKEGKRLLYSNDTGVYPAETWQWLEGKLFSLISFDCTGVVEGFQSNHMGIPNNREVKARLAEIGCVGDTTQIVITHFSHNGKLMHHEIEEEVAKDGFLVAYDGWEYEF